MKAPPIVWNKKKYCSFHQDHGHDTEDYIQLRDEILALIQRGYFRKFVHYKHVQPLTDYPAQQQANEETSN